MRDIFKKTRVANQRHREQWHKVTTFVIELTLQDYHWKHQIPSNSFPLPEAYLHYFSLGIVCRTPIAEQYPGFYLWFHPPSWLTFAEKYLPNNQELDKIKSNNEISQISYDIKVKNSYRWMAQILKQSKVEV